MKIGFDARAAVVNMAGVGYYSRMVIKSVGSLLNQGKGATLHAIAREAFLNRPAEKEAWHKLPAEKQQQLISPQWQLLLYTTEMQNNARLEPIRRLGNAEFRFPPAIGFKGRLWRHLGMHNSIAADHCAIYHGLTAALPFHIKASGTPSVVTIHDLSHRRVPEKFSLKERLIIDLRMRTACKNADRIIAISECTKRDIIAHYGIPEDKIDVIHPCVSHRYSPHLNQNDATDLKRRMKLPEQFILQIGSYQPRKNHLLTIDALRHLPDEVHLVCAGADKRHYRKTLMQHARQMGVDHRVHLHDTVDFRDLPTLYQLAKITVIPSYYEGFSLPIAESITCGTPIVAATGSSLEEAGGDAGLYVDPTSPTSLAQAIAKIIAEPDYAAILSAKAIQHSAHFQADYMAEQILNTYSKILQK